MRKTKIFILLIGFVLLVSIGSSYRLEFDSVSVDYGESISTGTGSGELHLACYEDGGDPCPVTTDGGIVPGQTLTVDGCEGSVQLVGYDHDFHVDFRLAAGEPEIGAPSPFTCGLTNDADFRIETGYASGFTEESTGGGLTIEPNNMQAHKGDHLVSELELNNDNVRAFFLTNDMWSGSGFPEPTNPGIPGRLMVSENDAHAILKNNDNTVFRPEPYAFYEPFSDNLKSDIYPEGGTPPGIVTSDGAETEDTWTVAEQDFTSVGYDPDYYTNCKTSGGGNLNSCTPLHGSQGNYNPEGEIMAGYQLYTGTSNDTERSWMICRDSMDGAVAMPTYPRTSGSVYDYYECNDPYSGRGDWEEITCDSGQEVRYESTEGGWGCYDLECGGAESYSPTCPPTVYKLNVQGAEWPSLNGYPAGLMIPHDTLGWWYELYDWDSTVEGIKSDCWMGGPDNRPHTSHRAMFDSPPETFTNGDDTWVVKELPIPPDTNTRDVLKYTCIFALVDDSGQEVYEGTNEGPFRVQIQEMNISKTELQSKVSGSHDGFPFNEPFSFDEDPLDGAGRSDQYCEQYPTQC